MDCSCDQCRSMCEHSTCLPTPDEARDLIRRGYGARLAHYEFAGLRFIGPAPKGHEGATLTSTKVGECAFYNDGKCELHGACKPLEGRLAHHDIHWLVPRKEVARHWSGKRYDSVAAALYRQSGISALIPVPTRAIDQTQNRMSRMALPRGN